MTTAPAQPKPVQANQPTPEEKAKDDAWRAGLKPAQTATTGTPRGGWANALRQNEAQAKAAAATNTKEATK